MTTINITLKLDKAELLNLEDVLRNRYDVIDLKVLPSTEKLYETDPIFKKLVKHVKEAQRIRDMYINEKN